MDQLELMQVAEDGCLSMVETFLARDGVDVNLRTEDENGSTALHLAACHGSDRAVAALLQEGADKDATDNHGETPLIKTAALGHLAVVEILAAAGADWRNPGAHHVSSPLHIAAYRGHDGITSALLQKGAAVNVLDRYGDTPLAKAAENGHLAVVKILLAAGADKDGVRLANTPLMKAAYKGHLAVVKTLLEAGVDMDIHSTEGDGGVALHMAADRGQCDVVYALVKKGADIDALDGYGNSPLMLAAIRGRLTVAETLVAAGADVSIRRSDNGAFAIHEAAGAGREEMVSVLLKAGADVDSLNHDGDTPLMVAASRDRRSVVEVLLAAGANVNARSTEGCSALDAAAEQGHVRILQTLLGFGADSNAPRETGCTALHVAALHDQAEAIEVLINAGADIELKTSSDGSTPLLEAAGAFACKAMLALLRHGAAVNALDDEGYTALHCVCDRQHEGLEAVVDLLLRWGADEMALDDNEHTPADFLNLSVVGDKESQPSQDEIERVRLLLAQAPADRAWRRRSWLVMISSRVWKARAAGCDTEDGPTSAGAASPKMARREGGAEETLGGHESTTFGGGTEAGGQGEGVVGVVTALLELELREVFRAVVSFL